MTNNKRFIVLLTAVLAVGLMASAGMAKTYKFDLDITTGTSVWTLNAGTEYELNLEARDTSDNLVSDYDGTVSFSLPGGDTIDDVAFTGGTASVNFTPTVADVDGDFYYQDQDYTITATDTEDPSISGSLSVNVKPSTTISSLTITGPSSSPVVDESFDISVQGYDVYGNELWGNGTDAGAFLSTSAEIYSDVDGTLVDLGQTYFDDEGKISALSTTAANLVTAGSQSVRLTDTGISSNSVTVNVQKAPVSLDVVENGTPAGSEISVTVDALALPDGEEITMDFVEPGGTTTTTTTTTVSGGSASALFYVPSSASSGETYSVDASYAGNSNLQSASDSGDILVLSAGSSTSELTIKSITDASAGNTFDVTVELDDGSGTKLSAGDQNVTVIMDPGGANVSKPATITTGSGTDDTVSFTAPETAGTYTIKAVYEGDSSAGNNYIPEEAYDTETVDPEDTVASFSILSVTPTKSGIDPSLSDFYSGDRFDIAVEAQDQYGNDFTGVNTPASVETFEINGTDESGSIGSGSVGGTGVITYTVDPGTLTNVSDTNSITLGLTGSDIQESATVDVDPKPTKLAFASEGNFDSDGENFVANDTEFTASIRLEEFSNGGWSDFTNNDKDVTFSFEGTDYTETAGPSNPIQYGDDSAEDDLVAPTTIGAYAISASYPGDDTKATGSNSATVVAQAGAVASITAEIDGPIGNDLDVNALAFTVTGYDSDDNPVSNASVSTPRIVTEHDGELSAALEDGTLDDSGQDVVWNTGTVTLTADSAYEFTISVDGVTDKVTVDVKKSVALSLPDAASLPSASDFQLAEGLEIPVAITSPTESGAALQKTVKVQLWKEYEDTTDNTNADNPVDIQRTLFNETSVTTDSAGEATGIVQAPEKVGWDPNGTITGKAIDYYAAATFEGDTDYAAETALLDGGGSANNAIIDPVSADTDFDTTLDKGWNLMSVGFQPATDKSSANVDTKVGQVFGTKSGAVFRWNGTSYVGGSDAGPVDPARGYWLYTAKAYESGPFSPFYYGDAAPAESGGDRTDGRLVEGPIEFELPSAGWHMISAPFDVGWGQVIVNPETDNESVADADLAGIMSNKLWAYSDTDGDGKPDAYVSAIAPAGTIEADKGYWVKTEEADVTLLLPFSPEDPSTVPDSMSMAEMGFEPVPEGEETPPAPPAAPQAASGKLEATAAVTSSGVTFEVLGANVSSINVQVFSTNGKEIFSESAQGNSLDWNANVANGLYLYGVSAKVNGTVKPLGIQKLLVLQ